MRSKSNLVNEPISTPSDMVHGLSYMWYVSRNGTDVGQAYYIESDTKDVNSAKRKIRKLLQSKPEFLHWL